jgi:hypothetical protein
MRFRPSSRIFGEKRGASPLARISGVIGDPPSRSVADSAKTQRRPVLASWSAVGPMLPTFSTTVVLPVLIASSAPTTAISVSSSRERRRPGCTASR